MSPVPPIAVGHVIAEKYRVESVIGHGGMGVVVAATNLLTDKRVAIKRMLPKYAEDPQSVERFLREARAAGRIDHPNVVDIYDVGRDGEIPFLVMELLRGMPLSEVVGGSVLEPASVIKMLLPAMRGIHAVHGLGLVHRDLKPDNIFLCQNADGTIGDVKVLDFGISKAMDEDVLPSITRTGALMGTPQYMSPEQVRGMKDIDKRTDVYALGVILYEGLTGRKPFVAETFTALAVEVATATPIAPRALVPELAAGLETVVLTAIARDRATRYPDVASLGRALEPFGDGAKFDEARPSLPIEIHVRVREGANASTLDAGSSWPSATTPTPGGPRQTDENALTEAVARERAAPEAPKAIAQSSIARPPMRSPVPLIAVGALVLVGVAVAIIVLSSSGAEPEVLPAVAQPEPRAHAVQTETLPAAAPEVLAPPVEPRLGEALVRPAPRDTQPVTADPGGAQPATDTTNPQIATNPARSRPHRGVVTRDRAPAAGDTARPETSREQPRSGGAGFRTGTISVEDF